MLRLVKENSKVLDGGLVIDLHEKRTECDKVIFQVAEKFKLQIDRLMTATLLPEENQGLQERTRQAATYFSANIESHLSAFLAKISFETDNKAIRKLLAESVERLQQEVFVKLSCFKQSQNGFETISYIKKRADAEVDFRPSAKQKIKSQPQQSKNIPHPELFMLLRQWRDNLADENGIPGYMVLPQKSMQELVKKLPANLTELKTIKGIGQASIKQFGEDIIGIINRFCLDKKLIPEQSANTD